MSMYLRALYLSFLLCAAIVAAACRFGTPPPECGAPCTADVWPHASFQARWRVYRIGLQRRLASAAPHAGAGFIAGALLRLSMALSRKPRRTARCVRDAWQCSILLHADLAPGARDLGVPLRVHASARTTSMDPRISALEREAFAWLAEHPDMPADIEVSGSERLAERCRREWEAAARTFGAGTLEAQLVLLRHFGKLVAYRKDPQRRGSYRIEADPAPLATHALRQLTSFRELPAVARHELMQALYALQSGWTAQELPARIELALQRLRAGCVVTEPRP